MPKPNYAFAKRQKELAKQQRKESKRERKSASGQVTAPAKPETVTVSESVIS